MAGHDAVVHFAAESHVDRSIIGPDDFVHTNCFGTNVVMRHGPPARDRAGRPHRHRRGLRLGRGRARRPRPTRSSPGRPTRPPRPGSDLIALSYYSTYDLPVTRHPLHQQLRPLPVPREGHPAVHHQPARRAQGPALRRRAERARLALRRRPLRGRAPGAARRARPARSTTSAPATRRPTACSSTSCSPCSGRARR